MWKCDAANCDDFFPTEHGLRTHKGLIHGAGGVKEEVEALRQWAEATKLSWEDIKAAYGAGRIQVWLSPLQAFRGLAEEIEGSWQEAARALGLGQERLLWAKDRNGHGTQLEFDKDGGYAAVVVWTGL